MQTVLSIDVTSNPVVGAVSEVSGRQIRVLERKTVDLGELFKPLSFADETSEEKSTDLEESEAESSSPSHTDDNINAFRGFLSSFEHPWTDAAMIIPAHEFVSLTLKLPFGDSRSIDRILDMEVQDLVPFDTDDFLIQHSTLGPADGGGFDVHVDLMPIDYVGRIMAVCRSADFEPRVLSSPTGILSAFYFLAPQYLAPNSAILASHGGQYHFAIAQEGDVRVVRVMSPFGSSRSAEMNGSAPNSEAEALQADRSLLLSQLKLTIASAEKRFGSKIEKIYIVGSDLRANEVQAACGRPVETLELSELIKSNENSPDLATLSGVFVQDVDPPPLLTNFRTRQFSYSPQLKELIAGLKQISPYLIGLLATLVISLFGIYFIREYRINSLREIVTEQVKRVIPDLQVSSGDEMRSIQAHLGSLGKQLKAIGSSSSLSPLDAFYVLSEGIPKINGMDFKKLEIRGEAIRLEGTGPSYTAVEQLTAALKKKVEFAKVDSNFRKGSGEQVSFTYTISLAEE